MVEITSGKLYIFHIQHDRLKKIYPFKTKLIVIKL